MTLADVLPPENRLQVFYPHLEDTVERLQVRRVLRRMHEFIRLMHEGLSGSPQESSKLNVRQEIVSASDLPEPVSTPLTTAFPVRESDLVGRRRVLAITPAMSGRIASRLRSIADSSEITELDIACDAAMDEHSLPGTIRSLSGRAQHFVLHLDIFGEHLVVRCVSPVGRLDNAEIIEDVRRLSRRVPEQLGIIEEADDRGIDLTVEEEVLLGDSATDAARVSWLVTRVTAAADRLEQTLWGDRDAGIDSFRSALTREGRTGTHAGD